MSNMQVSVSDYQGIIYTNKLAASYGGGKRKELIMKTMVGKPGYQKFEVKKNKEVTLHTDSLEDAVLTFNSL